MNETDQNVHFSFKGIFARENMCNARIRTSIGIEA
jgi:hypothetical protein